MMTSMPRLTLIALFLGLLVIPPAAAQDNRRCMGERATIFGTRRRDPRGQQPRRRHRRPRGQ